MIATDDELEELVSIPATRSPHGYLASPLSDNIAITDEGYLVVVGCPIARTGWQKYTVGDLPQDTAKRLGIDISNPAATIDLYRPPSEVFAKEFLESLNGKPITDGHPPGGEFVDPKNFNKYSMGHIQNVRKGLEPLEDGEWPVIADLMITVKTLIDKVLNKIARENSLGYDFGIDRDGDRIIQCNMLGNHNAVVVKGRAGDFVRIEDAAPEEVVEEQTVVPVVPVVEVIETIAYPPITLSFTKKEKRPVAEKKSLMPSFIRSLMGKHLLEKARATDADPEKFMDEVEAIHEESLTTDKARAKDDAEPPKDTEKNEFKSEDKKGKDMNEDGGAMDGKAKDRKAAHDALDRAMDGKATDADKKMLDEASPKDKDKEEMDDADPAELEKALAGEDAAEPCPDCGEAHDSEECPGEEEVESGEEEVGDEEGGSPDDPEADNDKDKEPGKDRKKAGDKARAHDAVAGARAVLKFIRPAIARTGDKAVHDAFNTALRSVVKTSRTSTGGYDKFATSARARDKAPRNPNPDRARAGDSNKPDPITALQTFYDNARVKGGK